MAFNREEAFAALASVNPAPVFLESYRDQRLPENLDLYFGPPEEFFLAPDTQMPYTRDRLVPILDDGNFGLVLLLDRDSRELVEMDVESPGEARTVFRHWQQYLAGLMIRIGESVDNDDHVRRLAALIGFAHIDQLFQHFARAEAVQGNAWWEARRQFPFSIPAGRMQ